MSMVELSDDQARQAIAEALDDTLVVEAAAGTGKTTELVRRVLGILETGRARMVEIVAVTFTEKAAGELKLRLREALELRRASASDDAVRARLEYALETLEEAHVNTIHGFCADLLRERPVEARVDPLFTVLTEAQSRRLYDSAFREWLERALQDPPEGMRRALRRSSGALRLAGEDDGPVDRLRGAGWQLAEWRDFPTEWRRPPFDRLGAIDRVLTAVHHLAELTAGAASERDNLFINTEAVRRLSRQVRLEQSFGQSDYDGWEARLVDLLRDRGLSRTRKGSGHVYGRNIARAAVLAARDRLVEDLQQFKRDADADLAACLQRELAEATARYQELKASTGALDFADLLTRARDLIKDDAGVRRHLQQKYARLFIDEFQDTDPIQAEILLLLSADEGTVTEWQKVRPVPGKLFIVGDPKQAIYRFRGTDVGTYWHVCRQLESQGGRVLQLTTSFRSLPAIQRFVNAAFERVMAADPQALQAGYVPLSPDRPADDSQPAVVALPVPRPYPARGPLKPSAKAIEASLPDAIGAMLAWLVDERNGWRVVERSASGGERLVPIRPRHIALLFRRFITFGEDVTRPYVKAIEARGIPHLLVGGQGFHGREEVETIRAALAAIEWPDDELSVFATLKGPLFAVDDAHLLEFRHRFGTLHPFRIPKELGGNSGGDWTLSASPVAHLAVVAEALRLLQQLHRGRNYRPVADTLGRLLADTRAHVGFVLRMAGEQVLANVLHVAELARQYEGNGGISFRGFIDQLREATKGESAEAPILEESSDGVRLMTVHKAKGLEFPVVILADMTCRLHRTDASRYLDAERRLCAMRIGGWAPHELYDHEADEVGRDRAEGIRLAYVAATRARDLLVVPTLGDGPWEGGWFDSLNEAVYPPSGARRSPSRGPKCPAFPSKDSVLQRPNDETAGPSTVAPGQHVMPGGYSVVWWEPGPGGGLALGARQAFGVRRHDLIVKDVSSDIVADGRTRYDQWCLARAEARARGAVPTLSVQSVREWTMARAESGEGDLADAASGTPTISVVDAERETPGGDRPRGAAFGTLVHAVLAVAPFDATPDLLRELAEMNARALGLGEENSAAAAAIAGRVLQHDVLVQARNAAARGACRRETPVTCTLPDGTLIEGIVDLAFEEGGRWTVVDYKTDLGIAEQSEGNYRRQLELYVSAVAQATGQVTSGVLMRI
jgi:ATP-dependent exoDNAse (exonuclease V) beta subunit